MQDGTETWQSCLGVLTVTDHELARLTILGIHFENALIEIHGTGKFSCSHMYHLLMPQPFSMCSGLVMV